MNRDEWLSRLKEGLLFIQEPMVLGLIRQDREYQESEKMHEFYAKQLQIMMEGMEENQIDIIEKLLDFKDENDLDYSSLSFIAGIQTGYWLKELLSAK